MKTDSFVMGDGTGAGTCTDAAHRCKSNGQCMCQMTDNVDGNGDGKSKGTCTDDSHLCLTDGTCKCQKGKAGEGNGDGKTRGTCSENEVCCANGECAVDEQSCT